MFRWNRMLRTRFGLQPEQSKPRRPKTTVKLNLEALEDRSVLST
jgi:hypothetical protein